MNIKQFLKIGLLGLLFGLLAACGSADRQCSAAGDWFAGGHGWFCLVE